MKLLNREIKEILTIVIPLFAYFISMIFITTTLIFSFINWEFDFKDFRIIIIFLLICVVSYFTFTKSLDKE